MTDRNLIDRRPTLRLLGALIGVSAVLGGCNTSASDVTAGISDDYRLRHPIAVQEANDRPIVIFVGRERGGLSASQRDDVIGLARTWVREGTGTIIADVPVDTPNAKAAAASFREIKSVLEAGGVPAGGIMHRYYRPNDPRTLPTIRLSYPRMAAVAGPCGVWPNDIGPSLLNDSYSENKQYYNFGCAYQRNMAAMIDNPSDLVQPRSETPAYTARRTEGFDKYRKGETTTTSYPESDKAKLSDTGK